MDVVSNIQYYMDCRWMAAIINNVLIFESHRLQQSPVFSFVKLTI